MMDRGGSTIRDSVQLGLCAEAPIQCNANRAIDMKKYRRTGLSGLSTVNEDLGHPYSKAKITQ